MPALRCLIAASLSLALALPALHAQDAPTIGDGRTVTLEYTLKLDDGSIASSNIGGPPLVYEHGSGKLLPKLEAALAGLGADDTKKVVLVPVDAYGEIDVNARRPVALAELPEQAREVGALLIARDPQGNQQRVRVHAINGEQAIIDYNHPLAGETLHFEIHVLTVE